MARRLSKTQAATAIQFGGLVLAAIFLLVLSRLYPLDQVVRWLRAHVEQTRPWSTLSYPLIQAVCNLLLLPGGVFIIASGFFFGVWRGFALVLLGHLLGAAAAFWITRRLARRWVERVLARRPQWRALDRAIEREGWKIVLLSQLNPLFPTSLLNYGYGLTRMRFWPCLGWIALGQAPGMFLYVYLGRLGSFGWKLWREGGAENAPGQTALWLGGLAASVGLTFALGRVAMRLLHEAQARAAREPQGAAGAAGAGAAAHARR